MPQPYGIIPCFAFDTVIKYYSRITVSQRTPNCIKLPCSHDVPSKRECGSTLYSVQAAVLQPNALDVPSMIALVANSIVSFDLAHVVFGKWKNRVEETAPLCHCFSLAKASLYRKAGREQDCSYT